jgi:hypothetical protein
MRTDIIKNQVLPLNFIPAIYGLFERSERREVRRQKTEDRGEKTEDRIEKSE